MIDVLVRCRNEMHWLPQLFRSLEMQSDVELGKILLVDNLSSDRPEDLAVLFPGLNVEVLRFNEDYMPGRMLNAGAQRLLELGAPQGNLNKVLIVSAHCFLVETDALSALSKTIDKDERCRAAFGRQVPMPQSDAFAVRDMALLYPKENRESTKAASFNNAFSMITAEALKDHLFDPEATNLEDIIWAAEEIDRGFKISYVADSSVAHHHGPHHSNNPARVDSTRATIQKYERHFHYSPVEARIEPNDILRVFVSEGENTGVSRLLEDSKDLPFVVWSRRPPSAFAPDTSLNAAGTLDEHWLAREAWTRDTPLFQVLPELHSALLETGREHIFVQIIDDSFKPAFGHLPLEGAIQSLKKNYVAALWPVAETHDIYFSSTVDGRMVPSQFRNVDGQWVKSNSYLALRGNGLVLSRVALLNSDLAYEQSSHWRLKKVEAIED